MPPHILLTPRPSSGSMRGGRSPADGSSRVANLHLRRVRLATRRPRRAELPALPEGYASGARYPSEEALRSRGSCAMHDPLLRDLGGSRRDPEEGSRLARLGVRGASVGRVAHVFHPLGGSFSGVFRDRTPSVTSTSLSFIDDGRFFPQLGPVLSRLR